MARNDEVATRLEAFADLLEARDVEFKPRAYRRAAENLRGYPRDVEDLAAEGPEAVQQIDGVGEAIAQKVVEYIETGEIGELEALREELPVDMAALTNVEGVGPKTVGKLYDALGITSLDELEAAAREGKIRGVEGFGEKTEQNILDNVGFARQSQQRSLLGKARPVAERLCDYLRDADGVERARIAGSLRRWRETIGDVDVLTAGDDPEAVVEAFTGWDEATEVIEAGTSKASVRADDMRVDLRVVVPAEFGSALQYFTGSKAHNVHLRNLAIERDRKMNEYGVFDVSEVEDDAGQRAGVRVGGETEAEMYDALDLPLIPPELREDRGEIEAAQDGALPDLVEVDEIRGDLHTHTEWSDGDDTIAEMVAAAADRGYEYHCVSDHAAGPGVFGNTGLTEGDLEAQLDEIDAVREEADIEVFSGVEANIDADGALTTDEDLLERLDVVVASPHAALRQERPEATARILAAVENPLVDVLGHPSGRLLNERPGLELDYERLAEAAAEHDTALEVNASYHRLDLRDEAVRVAVEAGALLAIDTDAHRPPELGNVRYGVHTARRGWAETADVLNARDADGVRDFLH
ncbi:MAG: DNA polymerase/3'-5' exonuclease PolX [Haloferacaceae archaeon]